jgi:hypothetical protein
MVPVNANPAEILQKTIVLTRSGKFCVSSHKIKRFTTALSD